MQGWGGSYRGWGAHDINLICAQKCSRVGGVGHEIYRVGGVGWGR